MVVGHVARLSQNEAFRMGLIYRLIAQSADNSGGAIERAGEEKEKYRSKNEWRITAVKSRVSSLF